MQTTPPIRFRTAADSSLISSSLTSLANSSIAWPLKLSSFPSLSDSSNSASSSANVGWRSSLPPSTPLGLHGNALIAISATAGVAGVAGRRPIQLCGTTSVGDRKNVRPERRSALLGPAHQRKHNTVNPNSEWVLPGHLSGSCQRGKVLGSASCVPRWILSAREYCKQLALPRERADERSSVLFASGFLQRHARLCFIRSRHFASQASLASVRCGSHGCAAVGC